MKKPMSRVALATLAAAALVLAGCATEPRGAKLTYETSPAGATLYEGGQSIGVAPQTRAYPAADANGGQIRTPEVTAVWPSGAKASFWTFLKPGDDNVTTIARPPKAPNLQADLDNAQKYAADEARRKASALRDQARSSARCQAQMQGNAPTAIDDCN
ncbi:MAG TPA: hypothetical protein VES00_13580 [Burkholderiaceae bacterium]|jgi:hypothetical protein|nr:hypothetical protein [Burkholderiaceae bacterium]